MLSVGVCMIWMDGRFNRGAILSTCPILSHLNAILRFQSFDILSDPDRMGLGSLIRARMVILTLTLSEARCVLLSAVTADRVN